MPFWSGGYLYVDSGIFSGTGRENLGISQLLNSDQNRLILYSMTATGQSVGILADGSDPEHTVEEQLKAGNQALAQAACCKTRFALIQKAVGRSVETAQDMGFCCLRPDLDRSGRTLQGPEGAESLLERITSRRGDVTVWLGEGVTSQGLRSFLIAVRKADGVCVALRETAVE